jgi:hypothetical protein
MAKISDNLREWAEFLKNSVYTKLTATKLLAIADRIDTEMVELPKSADGKIWTGREDCFWTGAGHDEYCNFHDLVLRSDGWYVEDDCGNRHAAESVWYERPDSLERIADELVEWCNSVDVDGDSCDTPRVLAERIHKLASKEQGHE